MEPVDCKSSGPSADSKKCPHMSGVEDHKSYETFAGKPGFIWENTTTTGDTPHRMAIT